MIRQELEPLGYHYRMRDFLRTHHSVIWAQFKNTSISFNAESEIELLKSGYRMDPGERPDLHDMLEHSRGKLGIEQPISLYQGDQNDPANACIFYTEERGHILFMGPFLKLMSDEEIHSTIGHELGHYKLWDAEDGDFLAASRILRTMANEPNADPSIVESERLYQLYTEIYADRAELIVMQRPEPVVSVLVKLETGFKEVIPENYIAQADELFEKADVQSGEETHPETYIRTRSVALWARNAPEVDDAIEGMIEGPMKLDKLDLLGQNKLTTATRQIFDAFFLPDWIRTEATLRLAAKYFEDFKPKEKPEPDSLTSLASELVKAEERILHYLTHVLLDLAAADPVLDKSSYAQSCIIAEQLGLADRLIEAAEEKTRPAKMICRKAAEILAKAENANKAA